TNRGADPRAHSREARRRLHRAADPRAGGGEARKVPRSSRCPLRSAGRVSPDAADGCQSAQLYVRPFDAVRLASTRGALDPEAVEPAAEILLQPERAGSGAQHASTAERAPRRSPDATPRALLRTHAQCGRGADQARYRGEEHE